MNVPFDDVVQRLSSVIGELYVRLAIAESMVKAEEANSPEE